MKSTLILLSFSVLLLSCNEKKEAENSKNEGVKKKETKIDSNTNINASMYDNARQINALEEHFEIKVGDIAYYSGSVHGSVGSIFTVDFDSTFFEMIEEVYTYDNPEKHDMPGGDSAVKTFYYKALKTGTFEYKIIKDYRGDTTNVHVVSIIITE